MFRNSRFIYGCIPTLTGVDLGLGVVTGLLTGFTVFSFLHYPGHVRLLLVDDFPFVDNTRSPVLPETATSRLYEKLQKLPNTNSQGLGDESSFHKDEIRIAEDLWRSVRVLCLVMRSKNSLNTTATFIKQTWGKRCNSLVFISSNTNTSFPSVGFDLPEGQQYQTERTMKAFKYVFEKHLDEADWFLKINEDTYVILENLRYFLSSYSSNDAVYFGHSFKSIVNQGFYCGGGGHVLSKEALRRLGTSGPVYTSCQSGHEVDVELGKCMESLGVETADSTDILGRSRFHCFDLEKQLAGEFPEWYYRYDADGAKQGTRSISDYAISFHVVPPLSRNMFILEFYIYHLRPYGIDAGHQDLNIPHAHLTTSHIKRRN
ncbi:glycoprotein-N-acetylgalactosamine 3-beta-galactosyltransferase 1-like isoform X2 [Argopecten irradians]|uniref:glycoprotein-N-acetylgalactosamine 3-beta-galactosyltransferase 1-like isoform X2 n=1 Tax=Argopecten irradians TaxID=31199 RepID=UPI003714C4AB